MADRNTLGGYFGPALLCFVLAAAMALLLLVAALAVWLSQVIGSLALSLLIIGGFFIVLAVTLYLFSLRSGFRLISSRLETIYNLAYTARWGFEMLTSYLRRLLR